MKRFENSIFKQREEINDRMKEMFALLKELTASKTLEKILIREEARHPITKNVNSISLIQIEEEENGENNGQINNNAMEPGKFGKEEPPEGINMKNEAERRTDNEPAKSAKENVTKNEEDEPAGVSGSHAVRGPVYKAILKKKITKKKDIRENFEIPCNIGGLKHMNALVDQGSDINIMPLSTYEKLTNKKPVETDIRLSLASHLYIYPLEIAEDVLVDVAGHVYLVGFIILNIREDEKRPFILGIPFLTTAKVMIKFDKGTITLWCGKSKISFHRTPKPNCKIEKGIKNDIEPISPR
ncbi:MAK10-like protein [Tanacetum coccineum]